MDYTLLSCIDSRVESPMKFYGRFELGPFAPGQGLTVANSLRRSLLSQLTGTAMTLVEIAGASHEYETLGGVRESVLDILLNLKQIILTSDFEFFSPQVGFLSVKGPGVVRARDLKFPDFIYAVDPNQYIATLTTNGNLNMKFVIACGKNHITHSPGTVQYTDWVQLLKSTALLSNVEQISNPNLNPNESFLNPIKESNKNNLNQPNMNLGPPPVFYQQWKNERLSGSTSNESKSESQLDSNKEKLSKVNLNTPIGFKKVDQLPTRGSKLNPILSKNPKIGSGYFTIDATFMPVTRVNYLIQASDDLQLAKDQIILEVWTNGSIHPRHAIHKAAKALIQLFLPLQQMKSAGLSLNKPTDLKFNQEQTQNSTTEQISSRFKRDRLNNQLVTPVNQTSKNESASSGLKKQKSQSDPRILNLDIGNLDLTLSPYSLLKQGNVNTINDLISYSRQQILEIPNFNQRWLNQVEEALLNLNLKLNHD